MERVVTGEETVIVERDGVPRVVVLSLDTYRRLKESKDPWERAEAELQELHNMLTARLGDQELPSSVEGIRQMRAERDEHLAGLR
jgi:PHD/YefM family antitoxin component YafN of YafNO toxin-antitoxin module